MINQTWTPREQVDLHHIQITASAPSHPIQHHTSGERTPMTPVGLVMAGCWEINFILANIGQRN